MNTRRGELLGSGAGDDEIEAVDIAIVKTKRTIERIDLLCPSVRRQAEEAGRARTEAAFAEIYEVYRQAQNDFRLAYAAAAETRTRLAAIIDAAVVEFGARATSYMPAVPADLTLEPDRLAAFEAEADHALAAEARRLKGEW